MSFDGTEAQATSHCDSATVHGSLPALVTSKVLTEE